MVKKESRFVSTYKQGVIDVVEVLVDKITGVNYVFRSTGYSGGMTVLVDKDGNPVVTPIDSK